MIKKIPPVTLTLSMRGKITWGEKTEEEAKNREGGKGVKGNRERKASRDPQSSVDSADSSYVKG